MQQLLSAKGLVAITNKTLGYIIQHIAIDRTLLGL